MIYEQISEDFKKEKGISCKDCWIADRKNALGFTTKPSPNRGPDYPKYPCPTQHQKILDELIRKYYG